MKYIKTMTQLKNLLDDYKKQVDGICAQLNASKSNVQNQKSIYSESHLEELLHRCDEVASSRLSVLRTKTEPLAEHYFDLLEKDLNNFFKGKIDPEIASKSQTFKTVGLQLTQREFDILLDSAKSYYDLRVLGQLAKDMKLSFVGGADDFFNDIDRAFTDFENYKGAISTAITYYAGENYELRNCVPLDGTGNRAEIWLLNSAYTIITNRASEKQFADTMSRIYSVLPESKRKTSLTDKDKRLIDSIVDSRYPALAGDQVKKICASSEELTELFSLDERYSKFVEEYYEALENGETESES